MVCSQWDVVVVPFPFVDLRAAKRRPALVLSHGDFNEHGISILAMITSARHSRWPSDVPFDAAAAGLPHTSVVRLKIFSLDNRLVVEKLGQLAEPDRAAVAERIRTVLPL